MASQAKDEVQKHHHVSYLRVILAILTVSGLTWMFGFIALFIGTSWARYIFVILNSSLGGFRDLHCFLVHKENLKSLQVMSFLHIRLPGSTSKLSSMKQEILKVRKMDV